MNDPTMTNRKMPYFAMAMLVTGLAFGTAWAVRGQFGHEQGAGWAGAIGAIAMVIASSRTDWYSKILTVALASAAGWGAGGMISYGMVVGYGRSNDFPNVFYGLLMLFVIGGLFGLLGGGLTGLTLESSGKKKVRWGSLLAEMTAGGIIVYYFLVYQLEILMTPPRSEAWAVCLGAGIAMCWHMARNRFGSSLRVAAITALGAGFGFAFGNFLQITGNILEINFNMWNVMEYSIGFFGGISLAYGVFSSEWPEEPLQPEPWENHTAAFLLFLFIPLVVFSQSFGLRNLTEKFGSFDNPEKVSMISNTIVLILFSVMAFLTWFLSVAKKNLSTRWSAIRLLLLYLGTYIVASYIITGAIAGNFLLNHHLYVLNFIVIFLLLRSVPASVDFSVLNKMKINRLYVLLAIIVIIIFLAFILINIHEELPGSQRRFLI